MKSINVIEGEIGTVGNISSEEKRITLKHGLNKINQNELRLIIKKYKISIPANLKKISAIKNYVLEQYTNGVLPEDIFVEVRTLAFNPELYANDGFFLSYDNDIEIDEKKLKETIKEWHEKVIMDEENMKINAEIELISFENEVCKIHVTRKFERFVHNGETMFSQQYFDIHSLIVEIDFQIKIIFIQTSNTVKYSSIKTVVTSLLTFLLYGDNLAENESIKLSVPEMKQDLIVTISEDGWTAKVHDNINPSTLKLLDLFLELENNSNNFDGFLCANITFDHEDFSSDLDDRIKNQSYGAAMGDLLKKEEIKDLILNNRSILKVEFRLTYTTEVSEGITRKHIIEAGIDNGKYLRIYIYNNDLTIKETIKEAYKDLKELFIAHLGGIELKNEERIKNMLGL